MDDRHDAQQHILLDFVEAHPVGRFGEGVDEEIERGRREGIEIDDHRLAGVDLFVPAQHGFDVLDDHIHLRGVLVADADGFVDAPVRHPRGILQRQLVEHRIGHVQRPLVEGAHHGQPPADLFHRAFEFPIRRADPVADGKRPVEVNHQPAEEVGEQVLGGETHRDAANAAESEHRGDFHAKHGQGDEHRDDDDDEPQHAHEGVQGRRVHAGFGGRVGVEPFEHPPLDAGVEPDQEPGEAMDDDQRPGRREHFVRQQAIQQRLRGELQRRDRHLQPQRHEEGPPGRLGQRVVPDAGSPGGLALEKIEKLPGHHRHDQRQRHQQQDLAKPFPAIEKIQVQ